MNKEKAYELAKSLGLTVNFTKPDKGGVYVINQNGEKEQVDLEIIFPELKEAEEEYNLSYSEASLKCLNNEGFIIGKQFAPGIYIKNVNGILTMVDGSNLHRETGMLLVTKAVLMQKYKLLTIVNPKALGLTSTDN